MQGDDFVVLFGEPLEPVVGSACRPDQMPHALMRSDELGRSVAKGTPGYQVELCQLETELVVQFAASAPVLIGLHAGLRIFVAPARVSL
jgi:hypothetical protein